MASSFWTESAQMITSGGIVALFALPLGLISWLIARQWEKPAAIRPRPWRVPWGGLEVLLAFLVLAIVPSVLVDTGLHPLAAGVVALPIQLLVLLLGWRVVCPDWRPSRPEAVASQVVMGIVAWAFITPPVLAVNAIVLYVFTALDWPAQEHPLTQYGGLTGLLQVLFFLQACVTAPLIEEVLFRGLLLGWVLGTRERGRLRPGIPQWFTPASRPWVVMGIAVLLAGLTQKPGPVVWAFILVLGLIVIGVKVRHRRRHVHAIYATASLFAVVHSQVWPSPIPLFVLGLSLSWLAVRTRGILVPFLVHGLFNAVSVVFVLRGGSG